MPKDTKNQGSDILTIPITKFASPSCYSFIVRYNTPKEEIELYLPQITNLKKDLADWLKKHKFEKVEANKQIYVTKLTEERKNATDKLLNNAERNGAFKIELDTKIEDLKDRAIASPKHNNNEVASKIADTVSQIVEEKVEKKLAEIIARLEANKKAEEEAIATAKAKQKEYETKVRELEEQLKEKELKLERSQKENQGLYQALEQQTTQVFEYQNIFGSDDDSDESPLGEETTHHLNSPFSQGENEIVSLEEYDDREMNKKLEPYKPTESKDKGQRLPRATSTGPANLENIINISGSLFGDTPLNKIDDRELAKLASKNGKN